MPVAAVLELLMGLLQAAPEVVNLITAAQATGGVVPTASIAAILTKYGIDRAVFVAAIANAQAKGV